jgi:hypothetical protein
MVYRTVTSSQIGGDGALAGRGEVAVGTDQPHRSAEVAMHHVEEVAEGPQGVCGGRVGDQQQVAAGAQRFVQAPRAGARDHDAHVRRPVARPERRRSRTSVAGE